MALNNRDRVGKGFDLLAEGLYDVVDDVMTKFYKGDDWPQYFSLKDAEKYGGPPRRMSKNDVLVQLRAISEQGYHFKALLSRAQQSFASELREARNKWAHSEPFSSDDAIRTLDTIERLLQAVDAPDSAADTRKLRIDLQRTVFEEQTRHQAKRASVSITPTSGLRPWREVIQPHEDVARGKFTASEFAADLHLVHTGDAIAPEYSDPIEFFSRTYLTEGLRDLLSRAIRRMDGDTNASPVINLQTNFGGGKTHSMLALYHLFGGTPTAYFPQEIQELIADNTETDLRNIPVKRVALVGTYLKAGSPTIKEDGTAVHTLWGELAWQLGGREAYDMVADDDRAGTNPGETLRRLIERYSPALILIDEWVAYARQLLTDKDLPAGSFDTQFTFAQSLTEAARSIPGTMVIVSIPASESGSSGADIEIGGAHGQHALERLQNVIRRVADQWRPSSKDESFEIVRRRLFQPPNAEGLTAISAVARNFAKMYRENPHLFPRDAASANNDYENRIRASYPLHPELLDRLYEDWSTLERFQRTRGVLKLVSSIVHELWASADSSPLILPGNVPLEATRVNTDLTQYLEDQWKPIIDSDIDGEDATARKIDLDRPNLGQRFVTQRIARTIFMGAAPRVKSTRKGLDKQYVWLGTAIPGDTLGNFGSALDLLAQRSTYFYEDQGYYWFDTQASISKTAHDHAEQLRGDQEKVWAEITRRLHSETRVRGLFDRVHIAPDSNADIPDVENARLVIVHPRLSRRRQDGAESAGHQWVAEAVESYGTRQRTHRNTLIFLMADHGELENLEAHTRNYLGWQYVQSMSENLNLSPHQHRQADQWVERLNQSVNDRIHDTFVWTLYPEQIDPTKPFELMVSRISDSGSQSLAERVSERLKREGQLITTLGPAILGSTLHNELGSLWESKKEITVGELWQLFTSYTYLPRLANRRVLDNSVSDSPLTILQSGETFAIASSKDPETGRYRDLAFYPDNNTHVDVTDSTLLLDIERAQRQRAEELKATVQQSSADVAPQRDREIPTSPASPPETADSSAPTLSRYFGTVTIDSPRYAREINSISREILDRLVGAGASVNITIDITATKPEGFSESEIRTINENARTLRFQSNSGFEPI